MIELGTFGTEFLHVSAASHYISFLHLELFLRSELPGLLSQGVRISAGTSHPSRLSHTMAEANRESDHCCRRKGARSMFALTVKARPSTTLNEYFVKKSHAWLFHMGMDPKWGINGPTRLIIFRLG